MKGYTGQKLLTAYSGILSVGVTVLLLSGFTEDNRNQRFDTITVQRINVVEPDGKLRMVVSNNNRFPGVIVNGHEYADFAKRKEDTTAGMLFFDAHATESGGLTFGGRNDAQAKVARFGHLSFDRYNQDQMLAIEAKDDGINHVSSIRMIDQPAWSIEEYLQLLESIKNLPPAEQQAAVQEFLKTHPLSAGERTLMANENYPSAPESSKNMLHLNDDTGKTRARLGVGADGTPALEFLDSAGNVTHRYPPN
jgi:hypothetical protein